MSKGLGARLEDLQSTQTFQNPLIKEYTLNYIRDPTIIKGIFLTVHGSNFGVRRATLKPELEHGKQIWSQGWEHKAAPQVI